MKNFKLTKNMKVHGLVKGSIVTVLDEDDFLESKGYLFAKCPDGAMTTLFFDEVKPLTRLRKHVNV